MVDREKLLAEQALGIGGSESPILLLGKVNGRTPEDLYNLKRGLVEPENLDNVPDIQRGVALEPVATKMYEVENGVTIDRRGDFFQHPPMVGHPDGIVHCDLDDEEYVVEIKCPRQAKYWRVLSEGVPEEWQIQCQHYMALADSPLAHLVLFCADAWVIKTFEIWRNERLIEIILNRCERFWDGVQRGEFIDFARMDYPLLKIGGDSIEHTPAGVSELCELEQRTAGDRARIAELKHEIILSWPDGAKKVRGDYGSISIIKKEGAKPYLKTSWRREQ